VAACQKGIPLSDNALFAEMQGRALATDACVMPQAVNLQAHFQIPFSEAMRLARQLEPLYDLYAEWYLHKCQAAGDRVRVDEDDIARINQGETLGDLLRWPAGKPCAATVQAVMQAAATHELKERKP
jgi:hypothetical protein